jgi:predicted nucleotidyltransferase
MQEGTREPTSVAARLRLFFEERRPGSVLSAYLFGSHGEGRARSDSDLDVALVVDYEAMPASGRRFELRVELTSELVHATGINEVDVVVLNDVPPLFARRVLKEGQQVFCRDADRDRDFRRDVQLRAADLAPFLERHARSKLAALAR